VPVPTLMIFPHSIRAMARIRIRAPIPIWMKRSGGLGKGQAQMKKIRAEPGQPHFIHAWAFHKRKRTNSFPLFRLHPIILLPEFDTKWASERNYVAGEIREFGKWLHEDTSLVLLQRGLRYKEKIERWDRESEWIEWIRQSENSTLTLETIKVELLPYALHMLGGLSEVLPAIEVTIHNYFTLADEFHSSTFSYEFQSQRLLEALLLSILRW
jgi:hypothetical protein